MESTKTDSPMNSGQNVPAESSFPKTTSPTQTPPTSAESPTPTRASRKKLFLVALVGILAVAALGGGYFLWQNSQKQTTQPSPTPTASQAPNGDLADWKTYTNSNLGISFKYPDNWFYQDDSDYGGADPGSTFGFYLQDTEAKPSFGDSIGNEVFILGFLDIDQESKKKFENVNGQVDGKPLFRYGTYVQILGDKKIIHLGYKEEGEKYLDQILSTFKFTN